MAQTVFFSVSPPCQRCACVSLCVCVCVCVCVSVSVSVCLSVCVLGRGLIQSFFLHFFMMGRGACCSSKAGRAMLSDFTTSINVRRQIERKKRKNAYNDQKQHSVGVLFLQHLLCAYLACNSSVCVFSTTPSLKAFCLQHLL